LTGRRSRITIVDVAAAAGFSVATVRRALRGFDNVAPATVARVKDVAAQLGYRPNQLAAQLRSGTTRAVAVIVPAINSWYFSELMAGAEAVLAEGGYDTFALVAQGEGAVERLLSKVGPRGRVDGVIVADLPVEPTLLDLLRSLGIAVVTAAVEVENCSSAAIDDRQVGYQATAHLLQLGHTRIALVGVSRSTTRAAASTHYKAGWHDALSEAGVAADLELEVDVPLTPSGGIEAASILVSRRFRPTAVFCLSDLMAIAAGHVFERLGFLVPDDISVIGFNDHEMASVFNLTTIRQPVAGIGATAARLLLDSFDNPDMIDNVTLPVGLVVRGSTAPPSS
jgi:DNA-binding LacI/PurR family transcriptional regulator